MDILRQISDCNPPSIFTLIYHVCKTSHSCFVWQFLNKTLFKFIQQSQSLHEKEKKKMPCLFNGSEWLKLTKMIWHYLSSAITKSMSSPPTRAYSQWFYLLKSTAGILMSDERAHFIAKHEIWGTCDDWDVTSRLRSCSRRRDGESNVTFEMWRRALNWSILTCVTFRNN